MQVHIPSGSARRVRRQQSEAVRTTPPSPPLLRGAPAPRKAGACAGHRCIETGAGGGGRWVVASRLRRGGEVGAGAAQPLPGGVIEREADAALVVRDLRLARRLDVAAVRRHLETPHVAVRVVELHLGEPDLLRVGVGVGVGVRVRVRVRLRVVLGSGLVLGLGLGLVHLGEPHPRLPDGGLDELALA